MVLHLLSAPSRNFRLILPISASALHAPLSHYLPTLEPVESPSMATSLLSAKSQHFVGHKSAFYRTDLYEISENLSQMTWLRMSELRSFSLALTMDTLSSITILYSTSLSLALTMDTLSSITILYSTSLSFSDFKIIWLALRHPLLSSNGLLLELH